MRRLEARDRPEGRDEKADGKGQSPRRLRPMTKRMEDSRLCINTRYRFRRGESVFGSVFQEFAQAPRGCVAVEFTCGYLQNEFFPLIRRQLRMRQQGVALQKDKARSQCGPFVAVDKGVIAAEVKQIRRCDLEWIRHQWPAH